MQPSFVLPVALLAASAIASGANAATVESLEAKLFLGHSGEFSAPLPEGATLWNTVIGEGGVREPSVSTFVVVVVAGQPRSYDLKARVRLAVTNKRTRDTKAFIEQLGVFSESGKQHVGFWLRGTGCDELTLEAGTNASAIKLRKVIPFRCGE